MFYLLGQISRGTVIASPPNCLLSRTNASPLLRRNDREDWPGTYLIEEVSHELANYRQFGLPYPHPQNSFLWSLLPFDIADEILFEYLALIDNFMYEEFDEIMYIHGFVALPVPVTTFLQSLFCPKILRGFSHLVLVSNRTRLLLFREIGSKCGGVLNSTSFLEFTLTAQLLETIT